MPFVDSNNGTDQSKIYYEIHGKDKSNTVILIHPIGGNTEIWRDEISLILKKDLRIVAYDLRGHGRSKMGSKNHFTISDLVQDLKLLIDSLGIKKCTLIGHSIGGSVASLYAARYPQNIVAIVLINGSSVRIPDKDLEKHYATRKLAVTCGMDALAEWARHESMETEKAFEDEKNWREFKRIFTKTSVDGFVAATNSLYSMPENVTDSLKNINYKMFGIVGEGDEVFMRLMHKMKEELPTFELRIIKDSDHWVIVEHPNELFMALNEFLEKIYPKEQP
jgi:pimeloyl-ACP methyl ester carboxylesterase